MNDKLKQFTELCFLSRTKGLNQIKNFLIKKL